MIALGSLNNKGEASDDCPDPNDYPKEETSSSVKTGMFAVIVKLNNRTYIFIRKKKGKQKPEHCWDNNAAVTLWAENLYDINNSSLLNEAERLTSWAKENKCRLTREGYLKSTTGVKVFYLEETK